MASSATFWLHYCTLVLVVPFQEGGSGMKVRSLVVHSNLSAFHRTCVIVVRWTDELFFFIRLSAFFCYPLLGRVRFRGRCWAAIQLSHRPEPSGRAVHGEVDGLDIGGRHGRRFVLRHTQGRTGGHTPFVQAGVETSDTGAEVVKPDPGSSWEGHCWGVCTGVWN